LTHTRFGSIIASSAFTGPGAKMPLASLHDLYIKELRDLHSAEDQLLKALPRMANGAAAPELRASFERHALVTEQQAERLGLILGGIDVKATGSKCKAMAGLIAEAQDVLKSATHPAVLDLALIGAALRIEHYEIVGYECVRTYAKRLGYKEAASLLAQTLEEEEEAEERLGLIAQSVILFEAEVAKPNETIAKKAIRGRAKTKGARKIS
jgi:ferritin-like metal-binding protein YciE